MSDRLSELVRQRALVLEHLHWLDREIAIATPAAPARPVTAGSLVPSPSASPKIEPATEPVTSPVPQGVTAAPLPTLPVVTPSSDSPAEEADVIFEQYRVTPSALKQDVRKGCLLYFVGAFVLLGIVIAILYFSISSS